MLNEPALQQQLITLHSEVRVLKEIQQRHDNEFRTLTDKADKSYLTIVTLDEHFKVYSKTLSDTLLQLSNVYVSVEKIKEEIHSLKIELESIDRNTLRCGDKFSHLEKELNELAVDKDKFDDDSFKNYQELKIRLHDLETTKLFELENKLSKLIESLNTQVSSLGLQITELDKSTKPIANSYFEHVTIKKFLIAVGGFITFLLAVVGGISTIKDMLDK